MLSVVKLTSKKINYFPCLELNSWKEPKHTQGLKFKQDYNWVHLVSYFVCFTDIIIRLALISLSKAANQQDWPLLWYSLSTILCSLGSHGPGCYKHVTLKVVRTGFTASSYCAVGVVKFFFWVYKDIKQKSWNDLLSLFMHYSQVSHIWMFFFDV